MWLVMRQDYKAKLFFVMPTLVDTCELLVYILINVVSYGTRIQTKNYFLSTHIVRVKT
jgi:hypothetical protein